MWGLSSSDGGVVGDPLSEREFPPEHNVDEEPFECKDNILTGEEAHVYLLLLL